MPKLKVGTIIPTKEEDAKITAAALADADNPPLTDALFAQMRPARKRGRPVLSSPKKPTNIRLSQIVIDEFKKDGEGWQTRIDEALVDLVLKKRRKNAGNKQK
jgi:uncharacterized protein (DUF4415 family)